MKLLNLKLALLSVLLCFILVLTTSVAIAQIIIPEPEPCVPTGTLDCSCIDLCSHETDSDGCDTCECYGADYFKCGKCGNGGSAECDWDGGRRKYIEDFSCTLARRSNDPGGPVGYSCRDCHWGSADSTASFCSECFPPARHLPSGENDTTDFGQYTTFTATECCGDDPGELRNSLSQGCTDPGCSSYCAGPDCTYIGLSTCSGNDCVSSRSNKYPFSSGASSRACCNNQNDGVYAATCYPPSLSYRIQDIGPSIVPDRNRHNVVVDYRGVWWDCDDREFYCEGSLPSYCGDLNWTVGGEVSPYGTGAFGEYDEGNSVECCGDDGVEFWNYRSTGCKYELGCGTPALDADNNDNWPRPYFFSDDNDKVCCNNDNDAIFRGACYPEGPYNFTSGRPYKSPTNTPNLVAEKGVWYDCDSDENTCTNSRSSGYCGLNWTKTGEYIECGEYAKLPGMPQGPLGGGPAEPLHDTSILKECCGDDPGEIYANTSQGRQGSVERFEACCNSPNDCVDFDGDCVTHCQFSQDNDSFRIGLPDYSNYQCILGDWWPKISGNVTDVYGYAIQGAEVRVVGAYFRGGHVGTWNTDSAGEYYIYVPNGTYDVLASKRDGSNAFYGYEDTIFFSVDIQEPIQVDFVLRNRSTDCTEDCTKSDGLCHASCDGLSGCSNFIAACDLAAPGIIRNATSGQSFNCCNNATVPSRLPADVSVCGDNVVKFVRPVVLRGQLVNMILVVFEKSPNC